MKQRKRATSNFKNGSSIFNAKEEITFNNEN